MHQKSDFKKIGSFSRWFEGDSIGTKYLVGISLKDKSLIPREIRRGSIRETNGEEVAGDPNYIVGEVLHFDLDELDENDNVAIWGIIRKCGSVEFSDDQIWAAFLQYQSEFHMWKKPIAETRVEFKERDPIGYDECMAGMERVLYKALGYL